MALDTELQAALSAVSSDVKAEVNKVVADAKSDLLKSLGGTLVSSLIHLGLGGLLGSVLTHFLHL